jgi:ribosomal protein L12E/L44/L45/RPP1/RPP2
MDSKLNQLLIKLQANHTQQGELLTSLSNLTQPTPDADSIKAIPPELRGVDIEELMSSVKAVPKPPTSEELDFDSILADIK